MKVNFPQTPENIEGLLQALQRKIFNRVATCLKDKNGRIYLDELDPKAGNPTDLVTGGCGIFCQVEFAHIMSKRTNDILEGKVSIYAWS